MLWWYLRKLKREYFDEEQVAPLIGRGDQQVVDALIKKLKHRNDNVRRNASVALGRIGDKRAFEPLLNLLAAETNPWSFDAIMRALTETGNTRSIPAMVSALKSDDRLMREAAAHNLWRMKHSDAPNILLDALRDSNREVVWTVASELGRNCEPRAIGSLLGFVHDIHNNRKIIEWIEQILEKKKSKVCTEDLLSIVQLPELRTYYAVSVVGVDGNFGVAGTEPLDISRLRELADKELTSRGLSS